MDFPLTLSKKNIGKNFIKKRFVLLFDYAHYEKIARSFKISKSNRKFLVWLIIQPLKVISKK